jgi:hypothetical protein
LDQLPDREADLARAISDQSGMTSDDHSQASSHSADGLYHLYDEDRVPACQSFKAMLNHKEAISERGGAYVLSGLTFAMPSAILGYVIAGFGCATASIAAGVTSAGGTLACVFCAPSLSKCYDKSMSSQVQQVEPAIENVSYYNTGSSKDDEKTEGLCLN